MKKQSFMTGALILMAANAISKILGAIFKIPLTYILNADGMAVYNVAFEAYIMFLSFIISGFPFAVSKLVAEANARKEYGKMRKIVSVSAILLTILGIFGSCALYFGARFFAFAMKEEKAVTAIQMISPSIFLVALGTAYKSYYQGVGNMLPTAVSQVAESAVKLCAGYMFAVMLLPMGTEMTAGGALTGVTAGELVATAILILIYLFEKKRGDTKTSKGDTKIILHDLMSIALPLLCVSVVSNAINTADTTLVRSRLLAGGFSADRARFLYGAYTGYALTVFHLPVGILGTIGVSILPVIAGAIASDKLDKAKKATDMAIRLTVILSLPCGIIMYCMSGEILSVLFHNTDSAGMLKLVSPCVVMLCVAQITAAILQSSGKITVPFFNSLIGSAVKLLTEWVLVAKPEINIYGSAIGATAAFTIIMILNLIAIFRYLRLKPNLTAIIIKPALAAACMLVSINLLRDFLPINGGIIYLAIMCAASCAVYAAILFLTGTLSIKDLRRMFAR